jgi:hypothetical protein
LILLAVKQLLQLAQQEQLGQVVGLQEQQDQLEAQEQLE